MPGDRLISSDAEVGAVAFSSDGNIVAAACRDNKVRLWDAHSGKLNRSMPWDEGDAAITLPSGYGLLATVGKEGSIKIWDLASGKVTRRIAGPQPRVVRSLAISPDRKLVAGSSRVPGNSSEDKLRLWELAGSERFTVTAGLGGTAAVAFSPDGATVAASSYDTNLRVWTTRDGELVRLIEELPVSMFAVAYSPDGKYLATAGADRIVYLWDAKSWKLARKFTGQPEMISSVAFSPDSRMMITGGFSEFTSRNPVQVLVWEVASGKILRTFTAPHIVRSAAFSPDGAIAATSSGEKAINIWAVPGAGTR